MFATQPKSIIVIVGATGDKDHARSHSVLPDACSKRGVFHLALYAPKLLLPGPELATGLQGFRADIERFCSDDFNAIAPSASVSEARSIQNQSDIKP
ncbi:hypothetical protein LBMAG50_11870 [Phycisphaerae bacterium]|nr:hypothetical protein LBMAG50_11870 [Phycisphaerae bacterium]